MTEEEAAARLEESPLKKFQDSKFIEAHNKGLHIVNFFELCPLCKNNYASN